LATVTATSTGEAATMPAVPTLSAMSNPIRDYDWGSLSALAQLQSRAPSGGPEAELWMGAHPAAPSQLLLDNGASVLLSEAITVAPKDLLGAVATARFAGRLPFMLKVLAITRPLSVQVHPDAARAHDIYRAEGGSPYVDGFHKPEMLYALEPTEALFGFRTPAQAAMLIGRLGCERLNALVELLTAVPDAPDAADEPVADTVGTASDQGIPSSERIADAERLYAALETLVRWPIEDRAGLVAEITAASMRIQAAGDTDYAEAFGWLDRLVGLHPADPMVLAPLLLDLVRMSPGQTIFVPAGVPHCYLSGLGIEILAASDNVLRCGLTSKPIDVEELLAVIDCRPSTPSGTAVTTLSEHEIAWRPDLDDFQLSRIVVDGAPVVADASIDGAQILLCSRGKVQVQAGTRTVQLTSGFSAFVTAGAGPLTLSGGGEVFRAATGLLSSASASASAQS
jgi:mannose-6-phosphate isomerase